MIHRFRRLAQIKRIKDKMIHRFRRLAQIKRIKDERVRRLPRLNRKPKTFNGAGVDYTD